MPFEWLTSFHRSVEKPEDDAEKTLAAYRLGMRAGGSIQGVMVQTEADCCAAAQALPWLSDGQHLAALGHADDHGAVCGAG